MWKLAALRLSSAGSCEYPAAAEFLLENACRIRRLAVQSSCEPQLILSVCCWRLRDGIESPENTCLASSSGSIADSVRSRQMGGQARACACKTDRYQHQATLIVESEIGVEPALYRDSAAALPRGWARKTS